MNLQKNGYVFMSKFVGTGSSSYGKRIYRAVVSQSLRNTGINVVACYMFRPTIVAIFREVFYEGYIA